MTSPLPDALGLMTVYYLCEQCQEVSTPSGRQQNPTTHYLSRYSLVRKKVPLLTLDIVSVDSLSNALYLTYKSFKH